MQSIFGRIIAGTALGIVLSVSTPNAGISTILVNHSFEEGATHPTGWTLLGGGLWSSDHAYSGERSIGGTAASEEAVWQSEPIAVDMPQSYRLSGWTQVLRGESSMVMEAIADDGTTLESVTTNAVKRHDSGETDVDWQYIAAECDLPAGTVQLRVRFLVSGEAYADDVTLVPLIENLLFNPEFNPVPSDRRKRVQFWDEDRGYDADPDFSMMREKGGSHRVDLEIGRHGSSLYIDARGAWRSIRNVANTLPVGATMYRFSGWLRDELGHANADPAQVRVVWMDRNGRVIRRDLAIPVETSDGWTRVELSPAQPPEGARTVMATILVVESQAWCDDFELVTVEPVSNRQPTLTVHVNQVGYEQSWPKSAVVAANFYPKHSVAASVDVISEHGNKIMTVPLIPQGRIYNGKPADWGDYYWRADFSELEDAGRYRLAARIGLVRGESPEFEVGHATLYTQTAPIGTEFFHIQRCGFEVYGWHKACHLDDALLPDGTHIDAVGGWHSAGDYNKLMYENGDGGCSYALLSTFEADPGTLSRYDRDNDGIPDALDEAMWGADFVAKMLVPETGALRKDVRQGPGRLWHKWSQPELHTDNVIGTDDDPVIDEGEGNSPFMIGGWARLSTIMERSGVETPYLNHATRLWNHATSGGTSGHTPHLMIGSLDLYQATSDHKYLDHARRCVEVTLASQQTDGRRVGAFGVYGEYAAGALAMFALAHPEDDLSGEITSALTRYVDFATSTAQNPFGLARQSVGDPEFFFEPSSTYGHNFEIFVRAWAALLIYRLSDNRDALAYAVDQLDWVLGKNLYGLCMMEGVGTVNPPRYHHRYDTIPGNERGAVPGAIPNGFVRSILAYDQPGFDMAVERSTRRRPSYRTSEPWLVHNMWHLMAIAELRRCVDK
jgi:hypothetical protein